MAGITGQGTTFNLPNFVGDLFGISPEDTPFLAAIGGLTGGERASAKEFEWEYYDLRSPSIRARLEGAAAPTAESRVRANASNVLQIIQEAVEVSYTKLAARNQVDGGINVLGSNPVLNEMDWQLEQALKQIALDVNYAFINGTYAKPADNATPRKTRGLLAAIATNAIALPAADPAFAGDVTGVAATDVVTTANAHGMAVGDAFVFSTLNGGAGAAASTRYYVVSVPSTTTFTFSATRGGAKLDFTTAITTGSRITALPAVTLEDLNNAMQAAYDNGGLQLGETRVAIVGPNQKRRVTKALITDAGYKETSRTVGGVNLSVIETDFGPLSIMMDRQMPADTIALTSLEDCAPVFLEIPGKGFLFVEPLAKTGGSDSSQIYGEIGLKYGNERKHAKITGAG